MRRFFSPLLAIVLSLTGLSAWAQPFVITLSQRVKSCDSLLIDIRIRRTAAPSVTLGPSNFVVRVDTSLVDLNFKAIVDTGIYKGYTPTALYKPMTVGGNLNFINVTVLRNAANASSAGRPIFTVDTLIARVYVKLKRCLNESSAISWVQNQGVITYWGDLTPKNNLGSSPPLPPLPIVLNLQTPAEVCSGQDSSVTAAYNGAWEVRSTIGSVFQNGTSQNTCCKTQTVTFGTTTVPQVDTLIYNGRNQTVIRRPIIVQFGPTIEITGPDTVTSPSIPITYTAVPAANYEFFWQLKSSEGSTFTGNPTDKSIAITFSGTQPDTLVLRGNLPGLACYNYDTLIIFKRTCSVSAGTISPDTTVCLGAKAVVYVTNYVGDSIIWQSASTPTGPFTLAQTGIGNTAQVFYNTIPLLDTVYFRAVVKRGACLDTSAVTRVAPAPKLLVGAIAGNTTICKDSSAVLQLINFTGTPVWQQSSNNINWVDVTTGSGFTTPNFTSAPITAPIYYRVRQVGGCDSVVTSAVLINVAPVAEGSFIVKPADVCCNTFTDSLGATLTFPGLTGFWTTTGSGFFTNPTAPNARYFAQGDCGQTVTLRWTVRSGNCDSVSYSQNLTVLDLPAGGFNIKPDTICAGSATKPLAAVVTNGTGKWSASANAGGTFSSLTDPNATYIASLSDAGKDIKLYWTITSGPCPARVDSQIVSVKSDILQGSFANQPFPICFGDTSNILGATAPPNVTTLWTSSGSGTFIPNNTSPNARYVPGPSDEGQIVTLSWTLSNSLCPPTTYSQNLRVDARPAGSVSTPFGAVCQDQSVTRTGIATIGTGSWSVQGAQGTVTFSNGGQTVTYNSLPNEVNKVVFTWTVSNASCPNLIISDTLIVSAPPSGSFTQPVAPICAGAITQPLGAVLVNGQGQWSCIGCTSGTFSDPADPNAFFNSDVTEAGLLLTLVWTVSTPGCGSISSSQTVQVNTDLVSGNPPLPPPAVCVGDTSAFLQASVTNGTGFWQHDGAGFFIPNDQAGNARYVSVAADEGKEITLVWVLSSPGCNSVKYPVKLKVESRPKGLFPGPLPTLCFEPGQASPPLGAVLVSGTGQWASNGTGSFTNFTDPNARYIPGFNDIGGSVTLYWIVSNSVCKPDTSAQLLFIEAPSFGSFNQALVPICAGSPTPTLNAVVAVGTGQWQAIGGAGSFTNPTSPTTQYISSIADAGKTIELLWIVQNSTCRPDTNRQLLEVLNTVIDGTLDTTAITVCDGELTPFFNPTVNVGNCQWLTTGSGTFLPNANTCNAQYLPINDGNKDVVVTLRLTNGACNALELHKRVRVSSKPSGNILNKLQPICAGSSTDSLFAVVFNGAGRWTCSNCNGTFSNPTALSTVYNSVAADGNTTAPLDLIWRVGVAGCSDSVDYTIQLVVAPVPTGSFVTTLPGICEGQLSIPLGATVQNGLGNWTTTNGGGGFTNSLNPNARYISIDGDGNKLIELCWNVFSPFCDSTRICQVIKVDAKPRGTFSTSLPLLCEGESTPPLGATATIGIGRWRPNPYGTFTNPNNPNTTFTPATGASLQPVILQWEVTNGTCDTVIYAQTLNIVPPPSCIFPEVKQRVCAGSQTAPLPVIVVNGVGTWTDNGVGGFFSNLNDPNATYLPPLSAAQTTVTLTFRMSNGQCPDVSYSQEVQVNGNPRASIVRPAVRDTAICFGDTITVVAQGGTSYLWTSEGGHTDGAQPIIRAYPTNDTYYIVQIFDGEGCVQVDSTLLIVRQPVPISATTSDPFPICPGIEVTLSTTGATGPFLWTPGGSLSDSTSATPIAAPAQTTTYTVRATSANGCPATALVTVQVVPFPQPVLSVPDVCEGSDLVLEALNTEQCEFIFWFSVGLDEAAEAGQLDETNPFFAGAGPQLTVPTDRAGAYAYTVSCIDGTSGCFTALADSFRVLAFPKLDFVADRTTVPFSDRTVNFTSLSRDITSYFWYFGDTLSGANNVDTVANPTHTFSGPGFYSIILVGSNGNCSDLKIINNYITVLEENFLFPTAFTPNGDGLNDRFRPLPADGSARIVAFEIYDQWNQKVFETTDYQGWDGRTAGGQPFDPGLYTYKCLINQQPDGVRLYTGFVTLIR
jgi:gliding motility-associated-like protein